MILRGRHSRAAATLVAVVVAALAICAQVAVGASVAGPIAPAGSAAPFVPGEAIVRFEPGTSSGERVDARREAGVVFDSTLGVPRAQMVEVEGSVEAAVRNLERQPGVAYAQPNYRYEALAPPPDDTFFNSLWGLSDPALPSPGVGALAAWDSARGSGQVIAVVDTGVDLTHPDLIGNLWTNQGENGRVGGVDDDSNGKVDDIHGFDFVDNDGKPDDYDFHGTHVAGTAAATADNGEGIAGVAPDAEIMAVRVLDGDGSGSTADVAAGIVYAAEQGAGVVNLSLGSPGASDPAMSNAINMAAANDVVVVVAAGNSGTNNDVEPTTPCVLPQSNLICVAALRQSGGLASFSNFGASSVDLAAPGISILSAQTDYRTLFTEGFEGGTTGWDLSTNPGSIPWGGSSVHSEGSFSVADSPGVGQSYAPNSDTQLIKSTPIILTGERGCRMHFDLRREIQPAAENGGLFDEFFAGAVTPTDQQDGVSFSGSSNGAFRAEEASISDLDNQAAVSPGFALFSDATQEFDGVYVDNLRLLCRDQTYVNDLSPAGNYVAFQGTSMATPHVAGVAALVRAAAPGATATEVVNAILAGVSPIPNPDPARPTVTGGIADACQAIAVATGNATLVCPGSSRVTPPPPPASTPNSTSSGTFTGRTSPPKDRSRPETLIVQGPAPVSFTAGQWKWVVFRFRSSEAGSSFLCQIDERSYHQCWRRIVRWFPLGNHVLRVKARDRAGNVDRSPAVYRFRVERVG